MKKIITISIFIFFLLAANQAQAGALEELPGPEIMPDSSLYFLKIWYEKIITFFSFGDTNKAERYSKIAERRLYEAKRMAEQGQEQLTQRALEEYEKYLNKALEKAGELKEKAEQATKDKAKQKINQTIGKITESTLENQTVLFKIYELVPERARDAIEKTVEVTKLGYQRAIEAISGIKKEELIQRAEEIKQQAQQLIKGWKNIFEE